MSLLKIGGATCGFGLTLSGWVIMGSDEDERRRSAISLKSLRQLNAGHPIELDIEDKAIESRLLLIRQKRFGGGIGDRLKASSPQQPAKGLADALIIIDNGDISLFGTDHRKPVRILGRGAKYRLLSFGEGRSVLSEYFRFQRESRKLRHGRHT